MTKFLFKLIFSSIKENKIGFFLGIISLSLCFFFVFFLNFSYKNLEGIFLQRKTGDLSENTFYINEKGIGGRLNGIVGVVNSIDENLVNKLKENPELKDIFVFSTIKMPLSLDIGIFGLDFNTDAIAYTVSDGFFEKKGSKNKIGISQRVIDLYNQNLGGSANYFPFVDSKNVSLIEIKFIFGKSSFGSYGNSYDFSSSVDTFDEGFPVFGITISESKYQEIKKFLGKGELEPMKLIGEVKNKDYLKVLEKEYGDKFIFSYKEKEVSKIKENLFFVKEIMFFMGFFNLILLFCFITYLIFSISEKNKEKVFVFRSLGGSDFFAFKFVFFEISFYQIFGFLNGFILFFIFEKYIEFIGIEKYFTGFKILFLNLFDFFIIFGIFFILIFLLNLVIFFFMREKS